MVPPRQLLKTKPFVYMRLRKPTKEATEQFKRSSSLYKLDSTKGFSLVDQPPNKQRVTITYETDLSSTDSEPDASTERKREKKEKKKRDKKH